MLATPELQGDEAIVATLLQRGVEVDAIAPKAHGRTPLHYAAQEGHLLIATMLLDAGARVDARMDDDRQPLALAAYEARGPPNERASAQELTGLPRALTRAFAAAQGHVEMVTLLLKRGAEVDAPAEMSGRRTPLHFAAGERAPRLAITIWSHRRL